MVGSIDVLVNLPLASAAVWLPDGPLAPVPGPPAALHTADPESAVLVAKVRATLFLSAWMAVLYFGRWLTRPRGAVDLAMIIPAAGGLPIAWTLVIQGVQMESWGP